MTTTTQIFNDKAKLQTLIGTAQQIRAQIREKALLPSLKGDFNAQRKIIIELFTPIRDLISEAAALQVVDLNMMTSSGVWNSFYEIYPGGGAYLSLKPYNNNLRKEPFFDTFSRAARHVERYARYAKKYGQPKEYGPQP